MTVTKLEIEGLFTFEPRVFNDDRGAFFESFNDRTFREATGFTGQFVQDNHSISRKGVVRGLHYQLTPHAQGKLVRVVSGAAFDVAVDIRRGSPTFGQWVGVQLSAQNHRQLWIPEGFAHGFVALEDDTHFLYKTTDFYAKDCEGAIRWDDAQIDIEWPGLDGMAPLVAPKDAAAGTLAEALAAGRVFDAGAAQ